MKSSLVILTLCTLSSAAMAQNIDRVKMTDNDMSCQQIYGEIGQMDGVIAKANQPQPVAAAPAADNSAGAQIAGAVVAQAAARSGFGGFGGFGGALGNLALSLAPSPYALYDVMFWLLGSLADRSLPQLAVAGPLIIAGAVLLLAQRHRLDTLALGEDVATSLGIAIPRLRWTIITATGIMVGAGVAVAGSIGFIGLVVPHLVRPLVGNRPGAALVPAGLAGAALLLAADMAVRLPVNGQELKLGVLTALLGAPFFLWLVVRSR